MGQYSTQKPSRGRDVVGEGSSEVKAPGVPTSILGDATPVPGLVDENGHINPDVAWSLLLSQNRALKQDFQKAAQSSQFHDTAKVDEFENKIERAQKWGGWIWGLGAGLVSLLAFVFTAGIAWNVFLGENATDGEVEKFMYESVVEHNGGVDPWEEDEMTHRPVGHHPEIYQMLQSHDDQLTGIETRLEGDAKKQRKRDLQSEYQFEFTRWQAKVIQAERRRRLPPKKPPALEDLEKELMGFGSKP